MNRLTDRNRWAFERLDPNAALVLNVGAGAGELTRELETNDHEVTAFDIDYPRIAGAKKELRKAFLLVADAAEMPFPDSVFDAAFMLDVYEHIPRDFRAEALRELHRVLRPGAQLLFSVPNRGAFTFADADNLIYWVSRVSGGSLKGRKRAGHPHFSLEQINEAFNGLFEIIQVHRGGLWIFPMGCILCKLFTRKPVVDKILSAMERDFDKDFGPGAYNLVISARKKQTGGS